MNKSFWITYATGLSFYIIGASLKEWGYNFISLFIVVMLLILFFLLSLMLDYIFDVIRRQIK